MWRRHNLLRPDSIAWDAMLRRHPGFADLPLVLEWAQLGRPVIVRRRVVEDFVDSVPAALPLPPYLGKRRLAFSFSSGEAITALPPVLPLPLLLPLAAVLPLSLPVPLALALALPARMPSIWSPLRSP